MIFEIADEGTLELDSPKLYLVGYSGRDAEAVRAHVVELAEQGVPAPAAIPTIWEVPSDLLSQEPVVEARRFGTSGEAEPVLLFAAGEIFVSVGSDHTDRELERTSMEGAKQACAKVVAKRCWRLSSVRPAWDRLLLRSEVEVDGTWRAYQEAPLARLLRPEWFVDRFRGDHDTVVFCGTVPLLRGVETAASTFRASLHDPASGGELSLSYRIGGRP